MILSKGTKVKVLVGYFKNMNGEIINYDIDSKRYLVYFGILNGGSSFREWTKEELEVLN